MGSGPSLDVPSWEGQTPTNQAPMQSNSAPINYTGSFGQPSNNFANMGKSPGGFQAPPPPMQQPMQPPMAQPMAQPMQQRSSRYNYNNRLGNDSSMDMNYGTYRR